MAGSTAVKPSHWVGLRSSLSQNAGDSSFGSRSRYKLWALRKKNIASGFCGTRSRALAPNRPPQQTVAYNPGLLELLRRDEVPERSFPSQALELAEERSMGEEDGSRRLFCLQIPVSVPINTFRTRERAYAISSPDEPSFTLQGGIQELLAVDTCLPSYSIRERPVLRMSGGFEA